MQFEKEKLQSQKFEPCDCLHFLVGFSCEKSGGKQKQHN